MVNVLGAIWLLGAVVVSLIPMRIHHVAGTDSDDDYEVTLDKSKGSSLSIPTKVVAGMIWPFLLVLVMVLGIASIVTSIVKPSS